jgi:hypothetical protein
MRKTETALVVLALGAMVAVGSATESMARGGGGGGHGGGGHGGGASLWDRRDKSALYPDGSTAR